MQHKTHECVCVGGDKESQVRVQRRKELPALRVCRVDAAVAVGFKRWQKKAKCSHSSGRENIRCTGPEAAASMTDLWSKMGGLPG